MADQEQEQDEKEPTTFGAWADVALAKVKELVQSQKVARLNRQLTPKEQVAAWVADSERAQRLRIAMSSDFWVKDLEPLLRSESSLKPCVPGGKAHLEEVAIEYLHGSGKAHLFSRVLTIFAQWARAGEEAEKRLKEEAEKQARLDKMRREATSAGAHR